MYKEKHLMQTNIVQGSWLKAMVATKTSTKKVKLGAPKKVDLGKFSTLKYGGIKTENMMFVRWGYLTVVNGQLVSSNKNCQKREMTFSLGKLKEKSTKLYASTFAK
jgi:hypothetical protein